MTCFSRQIFDRFKDSITFVSYFFRGEKTYLIVEKSRDAAIEKKDGLFSSTSFSY